MVIKKYYGDNDGIFELGDEIAVLMSDGVEVLEP